MDELNVKLGDYCANCLHNPCDCKLDLHIVSNCTTINNRKFIRPVLDGISTAVTQYQVVDELGQFWFQGTKEECEQFLYGC